MQIRKRPALVALVVLILVAGALPAWSYWDPEFNFTVVGPSPKRWIPLRDAAVPGTFRYGWLYRQALRDASGASIVCFVRLADRDISVDSVIKDNEEDLRKQNADLQKKLKRPLATAEELRVVRQQRIKVGPYPGFVLEVVGPGSGFSIQPYDPSTQTDKTGKHHLIFVTTRQRWYCVVRGHDLIGLLCTCADARFKQFAGVFSKVEKTLEVK